MAGRVTNVWPLPASAGLKHWAALQESGREDSDHDIFQKLKGIR